MHFGETDKSCDGAHTYTMAKKNSEKMIKEIYEGTVSAAECTGLLQKISVDPADVKKYHKEYTEDN